MKRSGLFYLSAVGLAVLLSPACTDEGEDDVGTGGSGTTGPTTSPSSTTGPTSSTGSSMGGGGNGGSGGGPSVDCLPASATDAYFTINEATLCAVATYTATGLALDGYSNIPSWGSQGGPLTVSGTDTMLTLRRWDVPADGTELTVADTTVPVTIQAGSFWAPQAIEIAPGVAIAAWAAAFPATEGGFVRVEGTDVVQADATGVFALGATQGRLLYTGLSAVGTTTPGTNALYGATVSAAAISADGTIDAFGDASGPIAVDTLGNAFVFMTEFAGTQELRGYAAADVAPGEPAAAGVPLVTLDGFGSNLAAIVPDGDSPGLVLFQPVDGMTFASLDVVAIPYTIAGGAIVAGAGRAPALTLTEDGTAVSLMTDDAGRVWVGTLQTGSTTDSVFFVLDRAPR